MKELLFILENLNDKRVSDLYDLISDKFGDNSEELFLVDDIITYNREYQTSDTHREYVELKKERDNSIDELKKLLIRK